MSDAPASRSDPSVEHDPPRRLRFGRFVLDEGRGALTTLDGDEIGLRPKSFAVLQVLVGAAGRLVSKDEIFAAVWPNTAIVDDVLVQSIGEIRRALGDDGPLLIRTVPRRGYRFEGVVIDAPEPPHRGADPPANMASGAGPALPRRFGFIGAISAAVLLAAGLLLLSIDWRPFPQQPGSPAPTRAGVAVLPLANHSDEAGRDYFADGLTQDIINALGRFSALTVMSWNAVLPYRERPAAPQEIGRRLGIAYLVEGSVRRAGDRLRVTAQLVDAAQGGVLWSGRYDEPLADLFALQDRITDQIVAALAVRVTRLEERRVLGKPTESLEAYDSVLRARPALQRPTRAGLVEARGLLRRAIELDPGYAAAHAALAETFYVDASLGFAESPVSALAGAEDLANRALGLDAGEVRARVILARIHIVRQHYRRAEAEIERAIAINPNDAGAIAGRGNTLMWLGQAAAAVEALEQARHIDPELNAMDRFALGLSYYLTRRYAQAVEQAELNLRDGMGSGFSRVVLAAALAQLGRAEEAARAAAAIRRSDPFFDPRDFGTKFLSADDLAHLQQGLRKAGLLADETPANGRR